MCRKRGEPQKKPASATRNNDNEEKDDGFPKTDGCPMIFGGLTIGNTKHQQMLARCEVYVVEPVVPHLLQWSESTIIFDWSNNSTSIQQPCRHPLIVNPVNGTKYLSKVLMHGGICINIMYAETLDAIGIDRSHI